MAEQIHDPIVRGVPLSERRRQLKSLKAQAASEATNAIEQAWASVRLDQVVVGVVQPSRELTTPRGVPLPLNAPMWRIHKYSLGEDTFSLRAIRIWYPELKESANLSTNPAPWSNAVATAMYLCLRAHAARNGGKSAESLLLAFTAYARFLTTAYRWQGSGPPTTSISLQSLHLFARWCEGTRGPYSARLITEMLGFVSWACAQKIPGFSPELSRRLREIRVRHIVAGHIARVGHPTKGALVEHERQMLLSSFEQPAEWHDPLDLALVRVCWEIGPRPVQLAAMSWGMLSREKANGTAEVRVPRAKTRKTQSFAVRTVSVDLFRSLKALRPIEAFDDDPIWGTSVAQRIQWWATLHGLRTDRRPPVNPRRKLRKRERKNDSGTWPLRLTAYRLRRTLATRLAEAGAGAAQIVAALDDDSLAMATVYAANSSSLVETLRKTLDTHPAWIRMVRLFQGRVADSGAAELPVVIGGAPGLTDPLAHARNVGIIGRCASENVCALRPPLDCYTCRHFVAEADPTIHRRQLAQLHAELDAIQGNRSDRMSVIHKRSMLAILDLIDRLEEPTAAGLMKSVAAAQDSRVNREAEV